MKTETNIPYKYYLEESELPTAWYNVRADMKNKPAPLLNPGTPSPLLRALQRGWVCPQGPIPARRQLAALQAPIFTASGG